MHPRLVAVAVLAVALVGCDAATAELTPTGNPAASATASARAGTAAPVSSAPATQTPGAPTAAPTAPPRTNPPATGAKVAILPANFGPQGSGFLLQLTGFGAGTRVTETVTNPVGVPKSALLTMGPDGSGSATFQTAMTDQPGVGRYTFRFDAGPLSITTTIDVTRP